jgi:hypothetical protein
MRVLVIIEALLVLGWAFKNSLYPIIEKLEYRIPFGFRTLGASIARKTRT